MKHVLIVDGIVLSSTAIIDRMVNKLCAGISPDSLDDMQPRKPRTAVPKTGIADRGLRQETAFRSSFAPITNLSGKYQKPAIVARTGHPVDQERREAFAGTAGKPLRVLVMDGDASARTAACLMLEAMGHAGVPTARGEEAIERFLEARKREDPFDLVMLDQRARGGMGGVDALGLLREADPNIRGILTTTTADDSVLRNYSHYGFRAALVKPYAPEQLRAAIGRACRRYAQKAQFMLKRRKAG